MASIRTGSRWMPFSLLPLATWWPQADFNSAFCWATGLVILATARGMRQAPVYGIMSACSVLSQFNPLLQAANIFLASRLNTPCKHFFTAWMTAFTALSIFPLPYSILFWGAPATALASWPLAACLKRLPEKAAAFLPGLLIAALLAGMSLDTRQGETSRPGFASSLVSENFLKNAILGETAGTGTSFVFEKGAPTEQTITGGGTWHLLAEHDDMNGLTAENPDFNADSIRQPEPWAFNRPCMAAMLRLASMRDPFLCSNLGCTIRQEPGLFPLAWRYGKTGIPQVVIGRKRENGATLYLVGDSDIAVDFLAPYNANFLAELYGQNPASPLPWALVLALASILTQRTPRLALATLCLLPAAGLFGTGANPNKFDAAVAFEGIEVKSPHIDNSPDKIVNSLSRLGKTVRLGRGNAKNTITLVGNRFRPGEESTGGKRIFFLLPGGRLEIGDMAYATEDSPLGNRKNGDINIPDAREITGGGKRTGKSLLETPAGAIIGTASPQRMADIAKLME